MASLLSKYAAQNARSEANSMLLHQRLSMPFPDTVFCGDEPIRQHELTLQGGFALAIQDEMLKPALASRSWQLLPILRKLLSKRHSTRIMPCSPTDCAQKCSQSVPNLSYGRIKLIPPTNLGFTCAGAGAKAASAFRLKRAANPLQRSSCWRNWFITTEKLCPESMLSLCEEAIN